MGNIITKLNLNRTPNLVDSNSLVFAKNIRVDTDGSIHKDYSIMPLNFKNTIIDGENVIVKYNDIYTRIISDFRTIIFNNQDNLSLINCCEHFINLLDTPDYDAFQIINTIENNNEFYILLNIIYSNNDNTVLSNKNIIVCYNEKENRFYPCNCNWTYSGGDIEGCVINNLYGEKLLIIGEYNTNNNNKVPLKCINLNKSSYLDNESLYTQTPNIPLINLNKIGNFKYTIPNGVYQFFIRYKIRDDFYTNWFPASKPIFIGNSESIDTTFGTLGFVNTHTDSDESIIFKVESLFPNYNELYKSFQIGFILNHDDAIYARAWKHFEFNVNTISFDYKATDSIEIEPTDLTNTVFQLYNIENIVNFKNKLYISNYSETDFNTEDLQSYADNVRINIGLQDYSIASYYDNELIFDTIGGVKYFKGIIKNNTNELFAGNNGIIKRLLTTPVSPDPSVDNHFMNQLRDTVVNEYEYKIGNIRGNVSYEGFYATMEIESLYNIKTNIISEIEKIPNFDKNSISFESEHATIRCNNVTIGSPIIAQISGTVSELANFITNKIKYLNKNSIFIDNNRNVANTFNIEINRIVYYQTKEIQEITIHRPRESDYGEREVTHRYGREYTQHVTITFEARADKLHQNNVQEQSTLIPYQQYKFYIHYVKQNGETTNGYLCSQANGTDSIIEAPYQRICNKIIYPVFNNIELPEGYVACFFSLNHFAINSSTIFNIYNPLDRNGNVIENDKYEASCIDINLGISPIKKDIFIKQINNNTPCIYSGSYYHSNDSTKSRYFGADGIIDIISPIDNEITINGGDNVLAYAVDDYQSAQNEDTQLIKCSPYIKDDSYDDYSNLNLDGYICKIYPLDRKRTTSFYTDGSTMYAKANTDTLQIKELDNKVSEKVYLGDFLNESTLPINIYSRYNLNYLTYSDDIKIVYKNRSTTSEEPSSSNNNTVTDLYRLCPSLNLSDVYSLPSMYKDYNKYFYYPFNKNNIVKFDNTIRSSELSGDESKIDIFRFNAEDYYNVPTNRGKIVKLLSVGDSILVHTEDSIFKFTGTNSLQSTSGEIQQTETDVFKTGVAEVFGSDFGFAGLQNKEDCIVTENGYIFFDRDSNIIYHYGGNGQIKKLSDSIEKLFRRYTIENIRFANDYYNNRFFVCIWFNNGKSVTLSYSFIDTIKSFVSLHDFEFSKAFNTKTKCYFITKDKQNICSVDKTSFGSYCLLETDDNNGLYPSKYIDINVLTQDVGGRPIPTSIRCYSSIIDIINNDNYEIVKTLDAIKWNSNIITDELPSHIYSKYMADIEDYDYFEHNNMVNAEEQPYPCDELMIYSDICESNYTNCTNISNDYNLKENGSYIYPRYNQGYWSFNYFRDITYINKDKFKYAQNANIDYDHSDNNPLIEGKYFVIRFVYNNNIDFKLETLTIKTTNKV